MYPTPRSTVIPTSVFPQTSATSLQQSSYYEQITLANNIYIKIIVGVYLKLYVWMLLYF